MYKNRIQLLQGMLKEKSLDSILITSHPNVFYLTGISAFSESERDARILITQNSIYLFTSMLYSGMVIKDVPHVTLVELSRHKSFIKAFLELIKEHSLSSVGFEKNNLLYHEYESLMDNFPNSIQFVATQDFVESARIIKDKTEQKNVSHACSLTDKAFDLIVRHVKSGVTERELAFRIDTFIREQGGEIAFPTIVAFGKNSAIPHHHPTDKSLTTEDTFVLFDFGANVKGYCSDMTRTVFFGKGTSQHHTIYQTALSAQTKGLAVLSQFHTQNFTSSDIQKEANAIITKEKFPEIPHSIGHGVGIEVHELPSLAPYQKITLEEGMIVTVEPGIYIPEFGGVRIEDTVLLHKTTIEILTTSSKELITL